MKSNFGLRVKNRTLKDIVLLWNAHKLTKAQLSNVTVFNDAKPLNIHVSLPDQKNEDVCCLITYDENNLTPYEEYKFRVVLGDSSEEPLEQNKDILAYGKLPCFEKDKKNPRVHMMGFDIDTDQWTRLPLKKLKNGKYAIPVVLINEDDY